jgi:hypothetical protein
MPTNRINATLNDAEKEQVLALIRSITELLPFLIKLSADERAAMPKFGEKNRSFVAKSLAVAAQNPDILPRGFDLEEMRADVNLVEALYTIRIALAALLEKVDDSYFAAGSEAYAAALLVYQYAKAHNLATGGLEDALDDLGRRFARRVKNGGQAPGSAIPSA